MRAALAAGLLALAAAPREDPRVFVEVAAAREEVFAGEAVRLTLRFGVEADLLRDGAVPISLRRLDVPVLVEAPWFGGLPGAPSGDGATFALNDGVARALRDGEEAREGRVFRVLEVEGTIRTAAPGEIEVAGTALRVVIATRFEEDAFGARVPMDRREIEARAPDLRIRVLPLPEEGRPGGFTGAVGRFSVRAEADRVEVPPGGGVKVVLRIEGEGNLASFAPPRLEGLEGFHVRGAVERRADGAREITYDLEPLGPSIREIPPIPFPHFDPGPPAGYRVARTDPIPLRVLAGPAEPPEDGNGALGAVVVLLLLAAAAAAVLAARRRLARAGGGGDAGTSGLAAAAAEFRARSPGDLGGAFAAFLGARLGLPPAAAVSPDLADRLAASGVPAETASRAARLLDRLVGARYGGMPPGDGDAAEAESLVEEIARG